MNATTSPSTLARPAWRAIGFWLAVAIGVLQAVNAWRAFADPAAFAAYLGLPLADPRDAGLVGVYALRTLFIALVVAALLIRRDLAALKWVALAGVVMPAGDAYLAQQAGAPTATVARHIAIGVYLIVVFLTLHAWTRRHSV